MTASTTRTIDDIGTAPYIRYEDDQKYHDAALLSDAKVIAVQLGTDIFEPLLISEYHLLFELAYKGAVWANLPPPPGYNDQKKRLFMNQLAPKLGPEEFLELLMGKIKDQEKDEEQKRQKKNQPEWEMQEEIKEIKKEAKILIEMMQDIVVFNKILIHINSERYRYSKG